MSRSLLVAGGISLLVVVGVLAAALLLPPAPTSEAERVERLAAELRCPDCQALSVAESRTRAADAIRREIAALVADGRSDADVRRHFVERYGEWILLAPGDPIAWWLPAGAVALGVTGFGLWMWRGRARPIPGDAQPAGAGVEPAEADRRRVREELEALDG
jgi:cytochrome c-type biogenesis protein CcmH